MILFQVPDTESLKSLVFASPGYHKAYLAVRQEVLEQVLARQYGYLLDQAEALIAVRSKGMYFGYQRDDAVALLDIWRRRDEIRALDHHPISRTFEPNGLEETLRLQSFYRIIDFFLQDLSLNAPRPPWMEAAQWNAQLPLTLSLSEKRRFARAVCRLQIMKNLFSDAVTGELAQFCDPSAPPDNLYEWQSGPYEELGEELANPHQMAWRLFYGTIPPWEYDEMGSAFSYFRSKVDIIAGEISSDLRRLAKATPCTHFWDIVPEEERPGGCWIEVESDLVSFPKRYEWLAALGPEFLYRTLRKDRLSRRKIICGNASANSIGGAFIGVSAEASWDVRFPFTDPADNLNIPQNFNQLWSKLPPHHQPSEGWKRAWLLPNHDGNSPEGSMDLDRVKDEDWGWCYALWDESRLIEWEAPLLDEQPANASTGA